MEIVGSNGRVLVTATRSLSRKQAQSQQPRYYSPRRAITLVWYCCGCLATLCCLLSCVSATNERLLAVVQSQQQQQRAYSQETPNSNRSLGNFIRSRRLATVTQHQSFLGASAATPTVDGGGNTRRIGRPHTKERQHAKQRHQGGRGRRSPQARRLLSLLSVPSPKDSTSTAEQAASVVASSSDSDSSTAKPINESRDLRRRRRRYKKESKHSGKGKGKGKGGKGKKGHKDDSYDVCRELDFGDFYGQGKSGKGSGGGKSGHNERRRRHKGNNNRQLSVVTAGATSTSSLTTMAASPSLSSSGLRTQNTRLLQFDGAYCEPNVLQTAAMDPELSIFVELLECTGLIDLLACAGPFTIFAPSNAAFEENPGLLQSFYNPYNIEAVQEMLLYHIVPGLFLAEDVVVGPLQTLLGDSVDVAQVDPLLFNQAGVSMADILACNGLIHVLDDVLIPPDSPILPEICEIVDFRQPGEFPVARRLQLLRDGLVADTASGGLSMGITTSVVYHHGSNSAATATVASSSSSSSSAQVVGPNHRHGRALQFEGERCDGNLLEAARQNPDLTTFVELVEAAGLADFFFCAGPFTVLAPVNDAFADLDPALVQDLLRPQNQQMLQEVLLYHILPGYQPSPSFVAGPTETLLFGFEMQVGVNPMTFDSANVVDADTEACNGILHTIDNVLSPDANDLCDAFDYASPNNRPQQRRLQDGGENCNGNILDTARESPELSIVVSLLTAAGLDGIFNCAGPFTALLPNNAAFDNLDPTFVEFLLEPENADDLRDLLLYHILPEATTTSQFTDGPTDTLLIDFPVQVTTTPIQFDGVSVATPNIAACNGYIHILNTVLNPFAQTEPPLTLEPTPTPDDMTRRPRPLATKAPMVPKTSRPAAEPVDETDAPVTEPSSPPVDSPVAPPVEAPPTEEPVVSDPPSTSPMASSSGSTDPPSDVQTVRVEDFFISFVAPNADREPTPEEYNSILTSAVGYFEALFTERYGNPPFVNVEASSDFTLYGDAAGMPEDRFNIYINFDVAEVQFTLDSTPPETIELFETMRDSVSGSGGVDFIVNVAQALTGSPFESTNEVSFAATSMPAP